MSGQGLRPLGVGEILDVGIKLYLRNARTLMVLCAVVVLPFQVLRALVSLSTAHRAAEIPRGLGPLSPTATDQVTSVGGQAVLAVIAFVVSILTVAACVKAVSDVYLDQPPSIGESLSFALRRIGSLVWMEIMFAVLLGLAFLALVIPGIWLYAAWSVATPALIIEGLGGWSALRRSKKLVSGRWWPTAAVLLVANVMIGVVGGALSAVLLGIVLAGASHSLTSTVLLASLTGAVSSILTAPFHAAVTTVLYYDLRVRHEGFDVELLARQLGILPAALGAPALQAPPQHLPGDLGPESVGRPGGPPFWPPPPGWRPPPQASAGHAE